MLLKITLKCLSLRVVLWGVWHSPEWPCSPSWSCTGDLQWRSHQAPGWTSGRAGRGTGGRSRETGEGRPLKRQVTSAHAWMIWNDTQGDLEPQVRCVNTVHQQTVRGVLRTAHCTRQCALWCPCHCSQCAPGCSCCAWGCTQFAVGKCSWIWGAGYIPFTPPVGDSRLLSAVTDFHDKKFQILLHVETLPANRYSTTKIQVPMCYERSYHFLRWVLKIRLPPA